ncbi:CdaR family transcriptional regulator [Streptococcus parauberis]|uniref:CdaR family transcriptional regulator n=1 Tax=Streptococcus parauberis TaxID=1348 RepID=UPI0037B01763
MITLDKLQAQKIVESLMEDIPYNINIMNSAGIIIASGDRSRIGQRHFAAEKAIKSKETVEVYKNTLNEKKGTNNPIVYRNEIIGVVGISGEPADVFPFTKIVTSVVLLTVQQMNDYRVQQKIKNQKKIFLQRLLDNDTEFYSKEIISESIEYYKINLLEKNFCMLSRDKETLEVFSEDREIFCYNNFYFFILNKVDLEKINKHLEQNMVSERLILGGSHKNIKHLVQESIEHWVVSDFFNLKNYVRKSDTETFSFLFKFHENTNEKIIRKIELVFTDYYDTLIEFAKSNCSYNVTSNKLHIHRNTLTYRLNKIYELTELDPNLWYDLCKLLFYFIEYYKKNIV